ncbi:MAG TPA: DUF177 domain-containing protein [Thermodesulfobacteriota bacterium]|nr:DUF177 domain-containing protein [Thermodesulfobacteriota bacterium]
MKINVDEMPDEGLSLDLTEEGSALMELAGGELGYSFISPVAVHLDLTKTDGNVFVSGEIKTSIKVACSRCLNEFESPFDNNFSIFYTRGKEEETEKELKPGDIDVNYLPGPELDTTELVLAQITLEMPMQPLCKPDCKGLCPRCGADLNRGDCGCPVEEKVDPRFAKLKGFKVE